MPETADGRMCRLCRSFDARTGMDDRYLDDGRWTTDVPVPMDMDMDMDVIGIASWECTRDPPSPPLDNSAVTAVHHASTSHPSQHNSSARTRYLDLRWSDGHVISVVCKVCIP